MVRCPQGASGKDLYWHFDQRLFMMAAVVVVVVVVAVYDVIVFITIIIMVFPDDVI